MADNTTDANPLHLVVFGPDGNCTLELCPIENSVYRYRPSLPANVVFMAIYLMAMLVHIWLGIRWRSWWFMTFMVLGCACAIIGYGGRVWMWENPFKFEAFMIQIVCVTTAPVYFTAAIYVTLAKTINAFSPSFSRLPPRFFYLIFIPCDIISLVLQAAGGALSTSSQGSSQTGVDLALAGLGFQVFTLVIFCAFFADYLVRYLRSGRAAPFGTRLKLFFGFFTLAVAVIVARCAFRVDELSEGYSGPLIADENLFIGLEGVLIVVAVFALCIGHPGFVFSQYDAPSTRPDPSSGEEGVSLEKK